MIFETDFTNSSLEKLFTKTPAFVDSINSSTSPTPLFVITGIPIAKNSANFVGDDACLENTGFIKNKPQSETDKYFGTKSEDLLVITIAFLLQLFRIIASFIIFGESFEINRKTLLLFCL